MLNELVGTPQHIYIKFGLVNFEGKTTNGWMVHIEPKKGRIKGTILES